MGMIELLNIWIHSSSQVLWQYLSKLKIHVPLHLHVFLDFVLCPKVKAQKYSGQHFWNGEIFETRKISVHSLNLFYWALQAYPRDIADLVPDHSNTASITIKWFVIFMLLGGGSCFHFVKNSATSVRRNEMRCACFLITQIEQWATTK